MSRSILNPYAKVTFSEDESRALSGGTVLEARDHTPGKCGDCVSKDGLGCALAQYTGPRCRPHQRKDGRSIIWVTRGSK